MIDESVKNRIHTLEPLSSDDWSHVLGVVMDKARQTTEMQPSTLSALSIRITHDLVNAIQKMDRTSAALSHKLVVLTWVLVLFTAALLIEPVVHFFAWFGC